MTKAELVHSFWSSFTYPAYEENSVPSGTAFPYITYQLVTDSFNEPISMTASIWDKKRDGYSATKKNNEKAQEIADKISRGGCFVGSLWITKGKPFAQSMGDNADNMIRRKVLNITAEFLDND